MQEPAPIKEGMANRRFRLKKPHHHISCPNPHIFASIGLNFTFFSISNLAIFTKVGIIDLITKEMTFRIFYRYRIIHIMGYFYFFEPLEPIQVSDSSAPVDAWVLLRSPRYRFASC